MEFILENLEQFIGYLFGAGGLLAYVFERRKKQAETKGVEADAKSKEIENSEKVVSLYKNALDDLSTRYEKKYNEITALYERKIKVLEDEIRVHKRMVTALKKEIAELRKQVKILEADRI